jgi:hypothetical protein
MLAPSDLWKNDSGGLDALGIFACRSPPATVWPMSGEKENATPLRVALLA